MNSTTAKPPVLADDGKSVPDSLREHLRRGDAAVAEVGLPDDLLATITAAGMVVTSWRNELEPWQYLFTDAQMSWMSLTATRGITTHIDTGTNQPDFTAIEEVLTDPEQLALPGVPARDAFGPAWTAIARRIARHKKTAYTARALASWGGMTDTRWWGCPTGTSKHALSHTASK